MDIDGDYALALKFQQQMEENKKAMDDVFNRAFNRVKTNEEKQELKSACALWDEWKATQPDDPEDSEDSEEDSDDDIDFYYVENEECQISGHWFWPSTKRGRIIKKRCLRCLLSYSEYETLIFDLGKFGSPMQHNSMINQLHPLMHPDVALPQDLLKIVASYYI